METELTVVAGAEAVTEPVGNGSAADDAATEDDEQPGPDGGADDVFNSHDRMSSSSDDETDPPKIENGTVGSSDGVVQSKEFIRLKHDFLCSRGGKSNRDHINNKIRNMVKTWVPDYMKAKDKKDKKNIVLETIDELNALKPPVRFFKKEQDSWIKVEEGQPVLEIVKAQFRHFEKSTWSEPAVKNDMVEVPVQDNNPVEVPVEDNVPVDGEWIIFGWPHDNREINFTELDRIETQ